MATTIFDAFNQFRSNLEITSLQESTTSTRQQNVREAVEAGFVVQESFLAGSYRRHTMIAPLSAADIDVFVVLDPKYYAPSGQGALLASLMATLKTRYPKTPKIKPAGQAVTITFTDFEVDVVPGFRRKGGGFLIPDASMNRWIATDPKEHVQMWSVLNKGHNGMMVPLIKMMKCWNRLQGYPLRSFHLEVMVMHVLQGVVITDYPSGVRWVFDKMRAAIWAKIADPAGYSDDIAPWLSPGDRERLSRRLDEAYNVAVQAESNAQYGYLKTSMECWRRLFGESFPAYG